MRMEPTKDRTGQRLHQHYAQWFVGDGVKVEFALARTYGRVEDVDAYVDGALKRPDESGVVYDYKLRGLTSGYDGERNTVKFAVAPPNTKNVLVRIIST